MCPNVCKILRILELSAIIWLKLSGVRFAGCPIWRQKIPKTSSKKILHEVNVSKSRRRPKKEIILKTAYNSIAGAKYQIYKKNLYQRIGNFYQNQILVKIPRKIDLNFSFFVFIRPYWHIDCISLLISKYYLIWQ